MAILLRYLGTALLALVCAVSAPRAEVPRFDRLVVFGDSLSDSGNAGRFSNGPVWVEQLAGRLGLPLRPALQGGSNFAVGGARLDPRSGPYNLRAQADLYLRLPAPPGRTLHVVYGGGNDVRAAVGARGAEAMVDAAVASARSIVADLAARGATDILVPNLPDIGLTPEMRSRGAAAVAEAGRLSRRFNERLDAALAEFARRPGLRLTRLDVAALSARVAADPQAAGFSDIRTPCGGAADCDDKLFWDPIHPTTLGHARMAEAAHRALGGVL
ncbi:MAG TPA: SGNH/GDSL hydrolase family protein [Alphaproteobacteria bacterium]|nr:SGNH/GDSL hydrolase family protein [Alphaproteobacteria bacterium]